MKYMHVYSKQSLCMLFGLSLVPVHSKVCMTITGTGSLGRLGTFPQYQSKVCEP